MSVPFWNTAAMELLELSTFRKIEMPYTAYAIDQQSCKDHNGLKFEEEVIKRVKELPIVKEAGSDYFFNFVYDEFSQAGFLGTIGACVSCGDISLHPNEEKKFAIIALDVLPNTVFELSVHHRLLIKQSDPTVRITEVRNQYELLVQHLVDSFNSSIKSVIHYFKTGDQLVTAG